MKIRGWTKRHPVWTGIWISAAAAMLMTVGAWLAHAASVDGEANGIWTWLTVGITWPRGIWLLLLIVTLAWPLFLIWRFTLWIRQREPPYNSYRSAEFFGLRWRWDWYAQEPIGIRAFCPECDLELDPRASSVGYRYECANAACSRAHKPVTYQSHSVAAVTDWVKRNIEREARRLKLLSN